MDHSIRSYSIWDACGNIVGLVELGHQYGSYYSCNDNFELRKHLVDWGRYHRCDSIMLLSGAQGSAQVHAEVFEPNSGTREQPGGISSMCGNGIRAVGAWLQTRKLLTTDEYHISTGSGVRSVKKNGKGYVCHMGTYSSDSAHTRKYARSSVLPVELVHHASQLLGFPIIAYEIGLAGSVDSEGKIDGEPHLVLLVDAPQPPTHDAITYKMVELGVLFTKNSALFPQEINTNVVLVQQVAPHEVIVQNYTLERNLGDNLLRSITQSCGTGATCVAGTLANVFKLEDDCTFTIHNMGGMLTVHKNGDEYSLSGPAVRIG